MTAATEEHLERLLREKQIRPHLIPISHAAWWDGVKRGIYPKGIKLSPKVTVWRLSDIQKLMTTPADSGNL